MRDDGTLWCWGANAAGQLGDGTLIDRPTPAQVGSETWRQVATGAQSTCAIRDDGSLWCWGSNPAGLGDGKAWVELPAEVALP